MAGSATPSSEIEQVSQQHSQPPLLKQRLTKPTTTSIPNQQHQIMRFSLLLVICAALSPILAAPMPGKDKVGGRKPGTNVKEKKAHELAPAHPGDIVLAKSKDFIGEDPGAGSSKRKDHPVIVVHHNPESHILHVAPIGHSHPGGVPTMSGKDLGIPETPGKTAKPSLVGLGPPKMIYQKDVKALDPSKGTEMLKLEPPAFQHLRDHIAPMNPEPSEKGRGKKKLDKREVELVLERRYILESMFDDEW
ncbi:hypothetical protein D9619_004264 [Psilocybe cf. subviscida]|uniref:Uncharacterized protein n=1 Tax=Psilocybe cf. subviscida TaxID=2480587 RepID=A0A8H5BQE5_9AGAR|nr:hypothetical protein D9619_004264 [Psilocybe cf. subviscida]